jgi:hypothetical protein
MGQSAVVIQDSRSSLKVRRVVLPRAATENQAAEQNSETCMTTHGRTPDRKAWLKRASFAKVTAFVVIPRALAASAFEAP